ncbi:hypothetical protein HAX54_048371 [Datura stramonium]|uniref:Uncharacterized protein n=1 Tax=Datura stramonium TaxID=4076 RepID=A0ABS8STT4_DATST|nr:hypothetical protein [Datura stramonium]
MVFLSGAEGNKFLFSNETKLSPRTTFNQAVRASKEMRKEVQEIINQRKTEYPAVYSEILKEQMEIANSKTANDLLNWEDLRKMRYSWNVASEVLRLAPPVHGTFREAIEDITYDGWHDPKGMEVTLDSR